MDNQASAFAPPPAPLIRDAAAGLLSPPSPPPVPTQYRSLGATWGADDSLPSLAALGIPHLGQQQQEGQDQDALSLSDTPALLGLLVRSLLVKYLELLGAMSRSPEQFPQLVDHLRFILINLHHTLNRFRPHQARESLILCMEDQLDRKRAEIATAKAACDRMHRTLLHSLSSAGTDSFDVDHHPTGNDNNDNDQENNSDIDNIHRVRDSLAWSAIL
ncbi:MED7 protein-domain-containing protein [Lipomyces japonicus]|uniref:MED7 protein-domain-containing protein n=1 Tax=Lipomyces japonicus TaxID=56871 RepID=UPI0034CECD98